MKLQCSCGAKYAFEATPDMLNHPVKFICPNCGLDASEFVNELIRREFAGQTPPAPAVPSQATPPPPPRMRVAVEPGPAAAAPQICLKHREPATEHCAVCHKPICPKCLAMFGYFCSPLCKAKAEAEHLTVPEYAGRGDLVEAKFWRKTGLIVSGIGALLVALVGVWIWYAWFGSVPHTYFSVRFEDSDRGYFGNSQLVGRDQIVFLHGGTLARYDVKSDKAIWTQELISKDQIADLIKAENESEARANEGLGWHSHHSQDDMERFARQALQSRLSLLVAGQNIWVANVGKLTHYDWNTGSVVREVKLPEMSGEFVQSGDELQMIGLQSVTHISLATGETRVEEFGGKGAQPGLLARNGAAGGLSGTVGDSGQAMDPAKVEAQAQNLNLQGRIALPALLSNARHEQELEAELRDDTGRPRGKNSGGQPETETVRLVSGPTGFVQFGVRLVEEHFVTRSAMQAPPAKSVLNGDLNATKTTEVANEILNDMQRRNGGDTVTENESRYAVTVHIPGDGAPADWTGEVVGGPRLYVLKTVNVVAAGKSVTVLDKNNKKLWSAGLTYPVARGGATQYGDGPCVEHGDTLYVIDQAVLTSFDLASGNARWRLPSVGVVGLFFDGQDNVYVNTTTGNPDDIKYSRQIDISRRTEAVVSKVESKTGKTLWTVKPGGFASYVSGKFIYVIDSFDPNPTDADVQNDMIASLQKPAFLHIMRLRPSNGRVMWDYYDRDRCPVAWNFDQNSIQLIFKREVQVLRYVTL